LILATRKKEVETLRCDEKDRGYHIDQRVYPIVYPNAYDAQKELAPLSTGAKKLYIQATKNNAQAPVGTSQDVKN
jgi:hypothetical protein